MGAVRIVLVVALGFAAGAGPLPAQRQQLVLGGFYHRVSGGFGDWSGATARLTLAGERNAWYVDARAQRAFGDEGVYGAITHVRDLSSRLFISLGFGGGTGEFVLPDARADATVHVKLGASRRVVVFAGGMLLDAKSGFEDRAATAGLTWYASDRAVLEIGGRINWSDPGSVRSERGFAAATLGRSGARLVVLRANAGREGYQLTGVAQTLRRFDSQEAEILWQEPIGRGVGIAVGATWYHNPFYDRTGGSVGLFYAW